VKRGLGSELFVGCEQKGTDPIQVLRGGWYLSALSRRVACDNSLGVRRHGVPHVTYYGSGARGVYVTYVNYAARTFLCGGGSAEARKLVTETGGIRRRARGEG
jgi:hypothetical protein